MSGRETARSVSIQQRIRPAPFRGRELRRLVLRALDILRVDAADLRIRIVGDAEMEKANRRFRGRPGTTNVLAFPEEEGHGRDRLAGDILVSAPVCLSQTEGWAQSPEERLFFFLVHGILHLLGHDHPEGSADEARMRRMEVRVHRAALEEGTEGG